MQQHTIFPSTQLRKRNTGFSLVELMVALAISMVVVIAASYVYLSTRKAQQSLTEKAYTFESAKFALDTIGRDIENAGFYPAIRSNTGAASPNSVIAESYSNPVTASPPAAYNTMVFGCEAQRYLPATTPVAACGAQTAGVDADTLVVNYFSNDSAGLDIGNRADCLRQDSANDASTNAIVGNVRRNANHATTAAASRPFLAPQRPLFVSNRYTLNPTAMTIEGQTINTFSLACNGNGTAAASDVYQPMIAGIDQLRFYFLVATDTTGRYRRANAVGTDWSRVVAVRVCLLARSLQSAKLQGSESYTINDCDGTATSYTDGLERRIFTQVFALKNQSHRTF